MGPGHSGKSATVYWLIRNQMDCKHVIWLDCRVWVTDSSFIRQLLEELSLVFSKQLPKDLVVRGDINFKELHKVIRRENKELIILMKNPEKLAEQTRPVLLYNILEWINSN